MMESKRSLEWVSMSTGLSVSKIERAERYKSEREWAEKAGREQE